MADEGLREDMLRWKERSKKDETTTVEDKTAKRKEKPHKKSKFEKIGEGIKYLIGMLIAFSMLLSLIFLFITGITKLIRGTVDSGLLILVIVPGIILLSIPLIYIVDWWKSCV